jgi:deoxycytidylate deaminase
MFKKEISNNLMMHLKLLQKQEQTKPKTSCQREIIKIRAEINEIETKEPYKKSRKQKVSSSKRLINL